MMARNEIRDHDTHLTSFLKVYKTMEAKTTKNLNCRVKIYLYDFINFYKRNMWRSCYCFKFNYMLDTREEYLNFI